VAGGGPDAPQSIRAKALAWEGSMKKLIVTAAVVALCVPLCLAAPETPKKEQGGGCILYGQGWAVMLGAPDGWIVECRGPNTGDVEVAVYPKGSTWADATSVMYVNSSAVEKNQTLEQFAAQEVKHFQEQQPTVVVTEAPALATHDKKRALVRHFTGDKWGNREAVAYVDGRATWLVVVLSARTDEDFKKSTPAFEKLIKEAFFMKAVIKN
jgi:hypothetical protein